MRAQAADVDAAAETLKAADCIVLQFEIPLERFITQSDLHASTESAASSSAPRNRSTCPR